MLLFQKRFHAGLVDGSISLTFRQWEKPRVKVGGRYRVHPIGVVEVDAVERLPVRAITEEDARRSGFASRAELLAYMKPVAAGRFGAATQVYRVQLHHGGDGDRVTIALDDQLGPEEIEALRLRLERFDARAPWTRETLKLIDRHPRTAASKLAAKVKRETLAFKTDVRKLKRLGLTQSFEVGYEISPRGRAFLDATKLLAARRSKAGARKAR